MTDIEMVKELKDSRLRHAAQMEAYITAAERVKATEIADLFRWAQADDRKLVQRADALLRAHEEKRSRRGSGD